MTPSEQRQTMIAYLKLKVETEDWHGVADAAMDLRELEAKGPETEWRGEGIPAGVWLQKSLTGKWYWVIDRFGTPGAGPFPDRQSCILHARLTRENQSE